MPSDVEKKLLTQVREALEIKITLPSQAPVLVAVSGGQDSMVLLHLLRRLGIPLVAASFDHGTRAGASTQDLSFVQAFCKEQQIPFRGGRSSLEKEVTSSGKNFEALARKKRYEFLLQAAHHEKIAFIATGHHLDDQVETICLGALGLASSFGALGMEYKRPLEELQLIRPMLHCKKEDIDHYAREAAVPWREDSSNPSTQYLRNRLRQELLPLLQSYGDHSKSHLAELAEMRREQIRYLDEQGAAWLEACSLDNDDPQMLLILDHEGFSEGHPVLCHHALRALIQRLKISLSQEGMERLREILADEEKGGTHDLAQGIRMYKSRNTTCFFREALDTPPPTLHELLPVPGEIRCGGYLVKSTVLPAPLSETLDMTAAAEEGLFYFDWQAITPPLHFRTVRPGESMTLPGGTGSKEIRRFLAEAGVLPEKRRAALILCDAENNLLLSTGQRSGTALVTQDTTELLEVRLEVQATPE